MKGAEMVLAMKEMSSVSCAQSRPARERGRSL
jgi:hypothetical protein